MRRQGRDGGWVRGVTTLVFLGVVLGVAYNWAGQRNRPSWGLSWIGEDLLAELEALPTVSASGGPPSIVTDIDDPMAIPAGSGLPEIPELDRPIQVELGALKQFFDAGAVVLVDARDPDEFAASHIPGAVNVPYDLFVSDPRLLDRVPRGKPVVTYCGGGACELSLSLAHELIFAGHSRVLVYMGGLPEWQAAAYPLVEDPEVTMPERLRRALSHRWVVRGCQIGIGLVFLWAGLNKLGDLRSFAQEIHNFRVLPVALENLAAMTLPWIEIIAALALLLGIRAREGSILAAGLMAVFTVAVVAALARGLDIECGCFGTADATRVGALKVAENLLYLGWGVLGSLRPRDAA